MAAKAGMRGGEEPQISQMAQIFRPNARGCESSSCRVVADAIHCIMPLRCRKASSIHATSHCLGHLWFISAPSCLS
jgi:hypothetical protein